MFKSKDKSNKQQTDPGKKKEKQKRPLLSKFFKKDENKKNKGNNESIVQSENTTQKLEAYEKSDNNVIQVDNSAGYGSPEITRSYSESTNNNNYEKTEKYATLPRKKSEHDEPSGKSRSRKSSEEKSRKSSVGKSPKSPGRKNKKGYPEISNAELVFTTAKYSSQDSANFSYDSTDDASSPLFVRRTTVEDGREISAEKQLDSKMSTRSNSSAESAVATPSSLSPDPMARHDIKSEDMSALIDMLKDLTDAFGAPQTTTQQQHHQQQQQHDSSSQVDLSSAITTPSPTLLTEQENADVSRLAWQGEAKELSERLLKKIKEIETKDGNKQFDGGVQEIVTAENFSQVESANHIEFDAVTSQTIDVDINANVSIDAKNNTDVVDKVVAKPPSPGGVFIFGNKFHSSRHKFEKLEKTETCVTGTEKHVTTTTVTREICDGNDQHGVPHASQTVHVEETVIQQPKITITTDYDVTVEQPPNGEHIIQEKHVYRISSCEDEQQKTTSIDQNISEMVDTRTDTDVYVDLRADADVSIDPKTNIEDVEDKTVDCFLVQMTSIVESECQDDVRKYDDGDIRRSIYNSSDVGAIRSSIILDLESNPSQEPDMLLMKEKDGVMVISDVPLKKVENFCQEISEQIIRESLSEPSLVSSSPTHSDRHEISIQEEDDDNNIEGSSRKSVADEPTELKVNLGESATLKITDACGNIKLEVRELVKEGKASDNLCQKEGHEVVPAASSEVTVLKRFDSDDSDQNIDVYIKHVENDNEHIDESRIRQTRVETQETDGILQTTTTITQQHKTAYTSHDQTTVAPKTAQDLESSKGIHSHYENADKPRPIEISRHQFDREEIGSPRDMYSSVNADYDDHDVEPNITVEVEQTVCSEPDVLIFTSSQEADNLSNIFEESLEGYSHDAGSSHDASHSHGLGKVMININKTKDQICDDDGFKDGDVNVRILRPECHSGDEDEEQEVEDEACRKKRIANEMKRLMRDINAEHQNMYAEDEEEYSLSKRDEMIKELLEKMAKAKRLSMESSDASKKSWIQQKSFDADFIASLLSNSRPNSAVQESIAEEEVVDPMPTRVSELASIIMKQYRAEYDPISLQILNADSDDTRVIIKSQKSSQDTASSKEDLLDESEDGDEIVISVTQRNSGGLEYSFTENMKVKAEEEPEVPRQQEDDEIVFAAHVSDVQAEFDLEALPRRTFNKRDSGAQRDSVNRTSHGASDDEPLYVNIDGRDESAASSKRNTMDSRDSPVVTLIDHVMVHESSSEDVLNNYDDKLPQIIVNETMVTPTYKDDAIINVVVDGDVEITPTTVVAVESEPTIIISHEADEEEPQVIRCFASDVMDINANVGDEGEQSSSTTEVQYTESHTSVITNVITSSTTNVQQQVTTTTATSEEEVVPLHVGDVETAPEFPVDSHDINQEIVTVQVHADAAPQTPSIEYQITVSDENNKPSYVEVSSDYPSIKQRQEETIEIVEISDPPSIEIETERVHAYALLETEADDGNRDSLMAPVNTRANYTSSVIIDDSKLVSQAEFDAFGRDDDHACDMITIFKALRGQRASTASIDIGEPEMAYVQQKAQKTNVHQNGVVVDETRTMRVEMIQTSSSEVAFEKRLSNTSSYMSSTDTLTGISGASGKVKKRPSANFRKVSDETNTALNDKIRRSIEADAKRKEENEEIISAENVSDVCSTPVVEDEISALRKPEVTVLVGDGSIKFEKPEGMIVVEEQSVVYSESNGSIVVEDETVVMAGAEKVVCTGPEESTIIVETENQVYREPHEMIHEDSVVCQERDNKQAFITDEDIRMLVDEELNNNKTRSYVGDDGQQEADDEKPLYIVCKDVSQTNIIATSRARQSEDEDGDSARSSPVATLNTSSSPQQQQHTANMATSEEILESCMPATETRFTSDDLGDFNVITHEKRVMVQAQFFYEEDASEDDEQNPSVNATVLRTAHDEYNKGGQAHAQNYDHAHSCLQHGITYTSDVGCSTEDMLADQSEGRRLEYVQDDMIIPRYNIDAYAGPDSSLAKGSYKSSTQSLGSTGSAFEQGLFGRTESVDIIIDKGSLVEQPDDQMYRERHIKIIPEQTVTLTSREVPKYQNIYIEMRSRGEIPIEADVDPYLSEIHLKGLESKWHDQKLLSPVYTTFQQVYVDNDLKDGPIVKHTVHFDETEASISNSKESNDVEQRAGSPNSSSRSSPEVTFNKDVHDSLQMFCDGLITGLFKGEGTADGGTTAGDGGSSANVDTETTIKINTDLKPIKEMVKEKNCDTSATPCRVFKCDEVMLRQELQESLQDGGKTGDETT